MELTLWLSFVVVCVLGTISPGPSLAVVLRQTLSNGRTHGVVTAASHSVGVSVWALLTLWGLGVVVTEHPLLYQVITYVGVFYLAWLGLKALRSKGGHVDAERKQRAPLNQAVSDGLMISLMNPKLALFFIALFSQFISVGQAGAEKLILASTVVGIDLLWFTLVALILSHPRVVKLLQDKSQRLDQASGLVMIGLAIKVAL